MFKYLNAELIGIPQMSTLLSAVIFHRKLSVLHKHWSNWHSTCFYSVDSSWWSYCHSRNQSDLCQKRCWRQWWECLPNRVAFLLKWQFIIYFLMWVWHILFVFYKLFTMRDIYKMHSLHIRILFNIICKLCSIHLRCCYPSRYLLYWKALFSSA